MYATAALQSLTPVMSWISRSTTKLTACARVALDRQDRVAVRRDRLRVGAGVELEHAEAALLIRARAVRATRR